MFDHFHISENYLNSIGLTKLQTQLISLFPKILLKNPAYMRAETVGLDPASTTPPVQIEGKMQGNLSRWSKGPCNALQ